MMILKHSFFCLIPTTKVCVLSLSLVVVALLQATPVFAKTLTIGTISAAPVEETHIFQPFADYLAQRLTKDGIDKAKVVIATDIHHMATLLKNGDVDLYIDSSVTALAVNALSGAQYMLRRWKKGRGQYRSVIFVRDNSAITTISDLEGKVIAFEEPFSTSGFMLPAMTLKREGMKLAAVQAVHARPPAGTIGSIMAFDNETQSSWVERGRVQAAAMAEEDFHTFAKTALNPLRTLYTTPYVPYHVVTHRPDLDHKLVQGIKKVLKSAHETQSGQNMLENFERTAKFDDIPEQLLGHVTVLTPFLSMILSP